MGKIGDLIVRLQLKHQDYEKGLKKAEKDTKGFSSTLGKLKGVGLAVWGAIGGAVLKVASDMVKATNQMQDKWELFTVKAKTAWDTFIKTLMNGQWAKFAQQYKQQVIAAEYLTAALQDTTEVENSISLQKAAMAEELASLEVMMRDVNLSYKERADAAQKYLNKVKPLYDQEIKRLLDLKKANMALIGAGVYTKEQMSSAVYMGAVEKFLIEYGKSTKHKILNNRTLKEAIDAALVPLDIAPKTPEGISAQNLRKASIERLQYLSKEWFPSLDDNFLFNIAKNYEQNLNSEQIQALVDSIKFYGEALAALDRETKRIQTLLAAAKKQMQSEEAPQDTKRPAPISADLVAGLTSAEWVVDQVSFDVPDIITTEWVDRNSQLIDEALAEAMRLQAITDEINRQFNNAVVSAISGATQALADCIANIEGMDASQVLAALLQPFASTMVSLGEILLAEGLAIEVFKTSLASLNGAAAIAAGIGLIALGSALGAGIKALAGKSSSNAGNTSEVSESSNHGIETYNQEITINVVGEISGDKILLAGQKTLKKWGR